MLFFCGKTTLLAGTITLFGIVSALTTAPEPISVSSAIFTLLTTVQEFPKKHRFAILTNPERLEFPAKVLKLPILSLCAIFTSYHIKFPLPISQKDCIRLFSKIIFPSPITASFAIVAVE